MFIYLLQGWHRLVRRNFLLQRAVMSIPPLASCLNVQWICFPSLFQLVTCEAPSRDNNISSSFVTPLGRGRWQWGSWEGSICVMSHRAHLMLRPKTHVPVTSGAPLWKRASYFLWLPLRKGRSWPKSTNKNFGVQKTCPQDSALSFFSCVSRNILNQIVLSCKQERISTSDTEWINTCKSWAKDLA